MNQLSARAIEIGSRYLLILLSAAFVVAFLVIAALRLFYPYELEWMEGATVDHVVRLLSGQPLFVQPSLDFVPFRYTPFYYYLSWLVAQFTGIGFVPLRLVSILSTLAIVAILFQFVKRETNSTTAAIAGAGFFAATYPLGGSWFDVGRCDMLFLAFACGGLYMVRFYRTERGVLLAALLFALSYLTKQVATLVIIPVIVYLLIVDRRRGVLFTCGTVLVIVATSLALDKIYDGWYSFYTFELGRHIVYNGTLLGRLRSYLNVLVLKPFPVASVLALAFIAVRLYRADNLRKRLYYLFATAGMTTAAFLLWINAGSYYNNLIPQHIMLALLFGCAIGVTLDSRFVNGSAWKRLAVILVVILAIGQLAGMKYNVSKLVPSSHDGEAGDRLVALMKSYDGDVLLPFHGYLPSLAGKPTHAHRMAMQDVIGRTKGAPREHLLEDIRNKISARQFSAIIVDHKWFDQELHAAYDSAGVVFADTSVFWPVTGWRIRPAAIFLPATQTPTSTVTTEIGSGAKQ